MSEISHYMKLLLKSDFPQYNLLNPKQFLAVLKKRNIHLWERDLEYFDKTGMGTLIGMGIGFLAMWYAKNQ